MRFTRTSSLPARTGRRSVRTSVYKHGPGLLLSLSAGQLLHLPTICKSARTLSHTVASVRPVITTADTDRQVAADEIDLDINHAFEFKVPLPKGARTFEMNTTLCIFSSKEEGKIVRLQDRPMRQIPDNALLSVSPRHRLLGPCSAKQMLRKINAVGVPKVVGLPENDKEDAEKMMKQQH
jgi:hypothetical protein